LSALPADRNRIFDLPGFDLKLIRPDFMHCAFLGMFLSTCGSMVWDLLELGHFGPVHLSFAILLASAFAAWKSWLRAKGFYIDSSCFTLASLGSPTSFGKYPELRCKAHDCRMCVSWLSEECQKASDLQTAWGKHRGALAHAQQDSKHIQWAIVWLGILKHNGSSLVNDWVAKRRLREWGLLRNCAVP
jgi:hypothetical protein